MRPSVRDQLADMHLQNLKMGQACHRCAPAPCIHAAAAHLRRLEAVDRRLIGQAFRRALQAAGILEKDAAARLHTPQTVLSRWILGQETLNLGRAWTLGPRFQRAFLVALAKTGTPGVAVDSVIRVAEHHA